MEQDKKDHDIQDDLLDRKRGEVGDVTITEYRKNQMVRLAECFIVSPLCIYAGIRYRKELPKWLSASLVVFGTASLIYNGRNFIVNWNRDGKLIREAIKQKKIEEKKVRDQIIKANEHPVAPARSSQKATTPSPTTSSSITTSSAEAKKESKQVEVINNRKEVVNDIKEELVQPEAVQATIIKPKFENGSLKSVVVSEVKEEAKFISAIIVSDNDSSPRENIESADEKKKEVEFVAEKPVNLQTPSIPKSDNNGDESNKAIG